MNTVSIVLEGLKFRHTKYVFNNEKEGVAYFNDILIRYGSEEYVRQYNEFTDECIHILLSKLQVAKFIPFLLILLSFIYLPLIYIAVASVIGVLIYHKRVKINKRNTLNFRCLFTPEILNRVREDLINDVKN